MARLVQCVPNFSEGRRADIVGKIVSEISSASRALVVDYSTDADHNRSVVTLIGEPEDVRTSVFAGAKAAVELIDLNKHKGAHPRIGAVDVIPLVPVHEVTMAEVIELSYKIGKDIAEELKVPVYFYERSAVMRHRTDLAAVRHGGFEFLKKHGLAGGREPDLGPADIHPTAGATVIGARGPLIAFNVNLSTNDIKVARAIAAKLRAARDCGESMTGVKAIAVNLASRGIVQVSTNITQPHATGIHEVYAFVEREANAMGVQVLESELIGTLHEEALIAAATAAVKLKGFSEKRILDHWLG